MNVIFIMSDEHSGSAIHASGDKYAVTPNLDRLIENGTNFTNAYTTCPVCAPARASWFTGMYVSKLGTWDNSTPYDGKIEGIAEYMQKYDVPVHHIGKTHFHVDGEYHFASSSNLGLLSIPDLGCYYRDQNVARIGAEKRYQEIGISNGEKRFDDKVLESTLSWLDEHKDDNKPWVLNVGFIEPHFPFNIQQDNWDYFENLFKDVPLEKEMVPPFTSLNSSLEELRKYFKCDLATEEVTKKIRIGYYASIKELDDKIGVIIHKLEEQGKLDDTAIIYTSDHGEQLGFHGLWWKCTMFEQSARIPMILSIPNTKAGVVDSPVSLTDVFPTLADMMNVPRPENIDGESFYQMITKENSDHRDFAFSEFNAHGLRGGIYMIRWNKYKYVFYTEDEPQLFDMFNDPMENHNLYGLREENPEIKNAIDECHKRLLLSCDPYEVTKTSLEFQSKMKKKLELPEEYSIGRGGSFVPHPDYPGIKR